MTSSNKYLALLRGVNVGGKAMIKMADLRIILTNAGFEEVETYIQSGNVLFSSRKKDTVVLADQIQRAISKGFQLEVDVVVLSKAEWSSIIQKAPTWWGSGDEWKHNLLVLLKPFNVQKTIEAIGNLKPDIERIKPGEGVIYQSMSIKLFGRTTTGKLSSSPIYKRMTVRNYNTSKKLLDLLN